MIGNKNLLALASFQDSKINVQIICQSIKPGCYIYDSNGTKVAEITSTFTNFTAQELDIFTIESISSAVRVVNYLDVDIINERIIIEFQIPIGAKNPQIEITMS